MEYSTLTQIKTRLNNECDLSGEAFIEQDVELLGYINSAIDTAEKIIHSLYEDYFLCKSTISLVSGTGYVSAPSDIYAHKIRAIVYNNSSTREIYEVKRLPNIKASAQYAYVTNSDYRFIITNDSTNGVRINLFPTPAESGAYLECWYIRNAKRLTSDANECDIPEFQDFIYAHVKFHVARKEKNTFDLTAAQAEYQVMKDLMEKTLTDMVPDEISTEVRQDTSFYQDFDSTGLLTPWSK